MGEASPLIIAGELVALEKSLTVLAVTQPFLRSVGLALSYGIENQPGLAGIGCAYHQLLGTWHW